jgi:hypothetical protein
MNLAKYVVTFPKHFKPIPKPYYVVACDEHFMVCTLTDNYDLIDEKSNVCWDRYRVRRWALEIAKEEKETHKKEQGE